MGIREKPVETNMYYCKSRYYVLEWCRWLNGDHICYLDLEDINGMNLFSYCNNNPMMLVDDEGDFAISLGFAIACGLVALFAAVSVAVSKPEVSSNLVSDVEFGPKSFGDFIIKSVADRFILATLPYLLTFVALDNVMMSKKKNPNPNARPDQKKQGREVGNKARFHDSWQPRNNYRNPKKRKKHTPGRAHRKFFEAILLFLLMKGIERY